VRSKNTCKTVHTVSSTAPRAIRHCSTLYSIYTPQEARGAAEKGKHKIAGINTYRCIIYIYMLTINADSLSSCAYVRITTIVVVVVSLNAAMASSVCVCVCGIRFVYASARYNASFRRPMRVLRVTESVVAAVVMPQVATTVINQTF